MKVVNYQDVELEEVNVEGAEGTKIRWLISKKDKAPTFAMRMFEVAPGGHTPYHTHNWEHEVFILEGEGVFVTADGEFPFKATDVIYAQPNYYHQFKNVGNVKMKFLCIIPHEEAKKKKKIINPFATGTANNC